MKKTIVLTVILLASAAFLNVSAQVAPPGSSDKDLRDTNIKGRSNELERIYRDAKKEAAKKKGKSAQTSAAEQSAEDKLAAKYDEIKKDYEQIQLSQDSIIKAYKSGDKIDYAQIGKFSSEINKSATRLNLNLFPVPVVENPDAKKVENPDAKKVEKTDKEIKKPKSVRDIIVELDDKIGSFATNPMFQNLRVVDAKVSEKARLDLEKIIELSASLGAQARKEMNSGK
ncbi:MAG: hypothetical protein M3033_19400 [Acidobacteriota bacterium]|nr:hypothetical protein [Acidobacteriota bacterium]